ncbi:MAG: response regulator [Planctomycetota bacterium]|nr:response regulator [Planctomycetota bacterium]
MTPFMKPKCLAGCRVLIVDDSRDITSLVAETFAAAGARPVEVNNGTDAMVFLMAGGFDIVVLDMVMPPPDGWRVLQFMRSRPKMLARTILLTANKYDLRVARTAEEYGVAHLFKPFLLENLITAACRLLAQPEHTTAA